MRIIWLAFSALLASAGAGADAGSGPKRFQLVRGIDEQAGLPYWQWVGEGISLTLVQRAPDQTRSFFEARGFDPDVADVIARQCMFKTIFANTDDRLGGATMRYDLREWRVIVETESRPLLLKGDWDRHWQRLEVADKARIAFRWALLPTQQSFEAGDHNWGMTSYRLQAGQRFDLEFVWHRGGDRHVGVIEGLRCAPDVPLGTDE